MIERGDIIRICIRELLSVLGKVLIIYNIKKPDDTVRTLEVKKVYDILGNCRECRIYYDVLVPGCLMYEVPLQVWMEIKTIERI